MCTQAKREVGSREHDAVGELWRQSVRTYLSISPRALGGCREVAMSDWLAGAGFDVIKREYHQQLMFPSEVILALNN